MHLVLADNQALNTPLHTRIMLAQTGENVWTHAHTRAHTHTHTRTHTDEPAHALT